MWNTPQSQACLEGVQYRSERAAKRSAGPCIDVSQQSCLKNMKGRGISYGVREISSSAEEMSFCHPGNLIQILS